MKGITSIILLITLFSCNSEIIERTDYQYSTRMKKVFLNFAHKGYQKEGKYFLAGCSNFFGESGREINLEDSFEGPADHHSTIQYTVTELNNDSIGFKYESKFRHHSFGINKTSIETGFFSIVCHDEKDINSKLIIDGEEVSKETAKKHIAEGKFYFLIKPENKINFSGTNYKKDDCLRYIHEKYGFEDYFIADCGPIEKYYQQMNEYNNTVFNFLLKSKNWDFQDYKEMKRAVDEDVHKCRNETGK